MVRKIRVAMLVDFMASSFGSTEDEYKEIEGVLMETYPDTTISFERKVFMHNLMRKEYDIFVFDWGGLLPGCEDTTRSLYRMLLGLTRKHEDRLYIMWSAFTERYFKDAANEEFPEFIAPNVVYRQDDHFTKRCRLFFGLPEVSPVEKPYHKLGESTELVAPKSRPPIGSSVFCQIDESLVQIIREEANGRRIIDCGAGRGLLGDMMSTEDVVSIDIVEQDNPRVLLEDSRGFPFSETTMPVFIRPCHSLEFVEETLMNCYRIVDSAIYISNPENVEDDLGIFGKLAFLVHNEWEGTDGEKVYRVPFTGRENRSGT